MKRVSVLQMLVLNAYWVGLSFMWNSLHPIILPAVLLNFIPDTRKNTVLGLLTFTGLIIAMVIQPLSGALSDRLVSRWGRRRPLILLGTLFDFVFLAFLAWSGGLSWVIIGYIGLQFSSNIAHGPAQALLPDRVPRQQIGAASGIKNFLDMAGLVVASLLAGRLLDPEARYPLLIMLVVMGVLAVSAAITIFGTPEEPSVKPDDLPGAPETLSGGLKAGRFSLRSLIQVDFRSHTSFWWLLAARFAFLLGIYGIQSFIQYYFRDVLKFANPVQQTGDLLAALTLALVAFAVAGGWLSDRFGARIVMIISGCLGVVGSLLLLLAKTPTALILYGSVLGAGIGLFLTSNWTMINHLAPSTEAGKFLGLTNLATAGSGAFGRLEGPFIDLLNNARPGAYLGYTGLFVFSAICALISIFLILRVKVPSTPFESN